MSTASTIRLAVWTAVAAACLTATVGDAQRYNGATAAPDNGDVDLVIRTQPSEAPAVLLTEGHAQTAPDDDIVVVAPTTAKATDEVTDAAMTNDPRSEEVDYTVAPIGGDNATTATRFPPTVPPRETGIATGDPSGAAGNACATAAAIALVSSTIALLVW